MPLSEFLRLFRGNLDSNQQKPCSSDPSSQNENGLIELVWDNGHTRHHENVGVESILNDEMVPLLSYPIDESPPHDFCFELLPEISRDKIRSGCDQIVSNVIKIAREVEPTVEIACSSVGSENYADHRVPCEQTHNSKRKFRDLVESEYRSDDIETESIDVMKKPTTGRRGSGLKRNRATEVHNLSERRRRDRINEKMRALQQLIPNCTKADKASMLDEAIEYMKTLQLQVQIMSMGSGLCIPPIMFRHVHPSNVSHFTHVGVGIGIGCHFLPIHHPFQGAHFPSPERIPGFNLPVYGNPNQVPRTPFVPQTPTTSAMGLSISNKTSKLMHNIEASSSLTQPYAESNGSYK